MFSAAPPPVGSFCGKDVRGHCPEVPKSEWFYRRYLPPEVLKVLVGLAIKRMSGDVKSYLTSSDSYRVQSADCSTDLGF
jgi:hypothetical protein